MSIPKWCRPLSDITEKGQDRWPLGHDNLLLLETPAPQNVNKWKWENCCHKTVTTRQNDSALKNKPTSFIWSLLSTTLYVPKAVPRTMKTSLLYMSNSIKWLYASVSFLSFGSLPCSLLLSQSKDSLTDLTKTLHNRSRKYTTRNERSPWLIVTIYII